MKQECLSRLILFGEGSLRRALTEYTEHYHVERNHQGKESKLLFPARAPEGSGTRKRVQSDERLGGLLKYYRREAACAEGRDPVRGFLGGRKAVRGAWGS